MSSYINIYLFTYNNGDGSSSIKATLDKDYIEKAREADDYPYDPYEDFGEGEMTCIRWPAAFEFSDIPLCEAGDWND